MEILLGGFVYSGVCVPLFSSLRFYWEMGSHSGQKTQPEKEKSGRYHPVYFQEKRLTPALHTMRYHELSSSSQRQPPLTFLLAMVNHI
jgi:hypothetical protein